MPTLRRCSHPFTRLCECTLHLPQSHFLYITFKVVLLGATCVSQSAHYCQPSNFLVAIQCVLLFFTLNFQVKKLFHKCLIKTQFRSVQGLDSVKDLLPSDHYHISHYLETTFLSSYHLVLLFPSLTISLCNEFHGYAMLNYPDCFHFHWLQSYVSGLD